MTYRQTFDRLGNPVYRRVKPDLQHRIIRWAGCTTIVICIGILLWGR